MVSPFEELEYIVDYLPDEGEAVIVTRKDGELVCDPYQQESNPDPLNNTQLYGRFVQANERLQSCCLHPILISVLGCFCLCVLMHNIFDTGWKSWYLDIGIILFSITGCIQWIQRKQSHTFRTQVRPMLHWQLRMLGLDRFRIIGSLRHRPELKTLLRLIVQNGE